jgi:hypothetical protein
VICYEAADDKGNTSTPECVDVSVLPDPPPQFAPPVDDGRVGNMSADVIVTMGATKAYTITAFDANCLDALTLTISPDTPLPEGAVFSPQAPAPSTVACERRAADQTVAATLSWDAPHTFGGTVQQICFRATDACGECECAGGSDTVEACVTFRVAKCRYSIGQEHELAEVGRLYGADWLQLWKMNPEVAGLPPGSLVAVMNRVDFWDRVVLSPTECFSRGEKLISINRMLRVSLAGEAPRLHPLPGAEHRHWAHALRWAQRLALRPRAALRHHCAGPRDSALPARPAPS